MQSCLTAYHFRETKDGGTEAVFTSSLNPHPPFGLSPDFVSKLTWGKTVDFAKSLQGHALKLAQGDDSQLIVPSSDLLPSASVHAPAKCSSLLKAAWEELDNLAVKELISPCGKGGKQVPRYGRFPPP